MSLSAVASSSADKGSSLFEQSCDDFGADFFDQFLSFEPIDNEIYDNPGLPESTVFARATIANNIRATSSSLLSEMPAMSHHSYHTSAPGDFFYTELSGRDAISDSELLGLENISLGSPVSPVFSKIRARSNTSILPTASIIDRRRARLAEASQMAFKKAQDSDKSHRSPIRKSSHSPKMARASENFQNSLDMWGNVMNSKFRYDFEGPVAPSTPPQGARLSNASESSSTTFTKDSHADVFDFSNGSPQQLNDRPTEYDTPLTTPGLDGGHSRKTSGNQTFSDGMGFPPTPQFHRSSGSWSQIPGSSELNYATPAVHTPDIDAPVWWNHAATAPMAQPSPTALHINPQRASKSLAYQLQNEVSYEADGLASAKAPPSGLMIQMPETPAQQSFVVQSPHMQSPHMHSPHMHSPHMPQQYYFAHPQPSPSRQQYPPPPGPYIPESSGHAPHSSPMRKSRSSARDHSESPSPKTQSSNFQIKKRRTKGSKEKKTPTAATVDFVNFTPSDSKKILTGVAPSGSSKTRARREKEAMEKSKKLSLAMLRAVKAAGGDVDSLVEQGLFV